MQRPATLDPTRRSSRVAVWLTLATLLSWGSMVIHDLVELPLSPLAPENTGPLAVALLLLAAALAWPGSRIPILALFAWATLNLVGGGIISVLPLPILPFEPEQSLQHYLMHVAYSLGQVPLLVLTASMLLRGASSDREAARGEARPGAEGAGSRR